MMSARRTFMSHASEDKPFVLPLAERLRQDGVDAWLDYWEILAGESLTQKIFDEGIKDCEAFVIVLSPVSVTKRWVREELDAAFALRIERSTRLIAVRLDECEVPVVLKSRLWIDMQRQGDNEAAYRRLLNAIHEHRERPAIGPNPFDGAPPPDSGATYDEEAVLDACLQIAFDSHHPLDVVSAAALTARTGLPLETICEAVEMHEADGLLGLTRLGTGEFWATIKPWGWQRRAQAAVGFDPDDDVRRVVSTVASGGALGGQKLLAASGLDVKRGFIATKLAETYGYVRVSWGMSADGFGAHHVEATPTGRRHVR